MLFLFLSVATGDHITSTYAVIPFVQCGPIDILACFTGNCIPNVGGFGNVVKYDFYNKALLVVYVCGAGIEWCEMWKMFYGLVVIRSCL